MMIEMGDRRRITILTYGSRGDVEPFVALGFGLRNVGHAVRLAGPAPFAPLVDAHGLEFDPIEGNPEELAQAFQDSPHIRILCAPSHTPVEFLRLLFLFDRQLDELLESADRLHGFAGSPLCS